MALAAAGVVALSLFTASGPAADVNASARPLAKPAVRLSLLRVCSYEGFSQGTNACGRDERATPVLSRYAVCSIRVDVRRRTRVTGRVTYEGAVVQALSKMLAPGAYTAVVGAGLPGTDVPGGSYRCEFSAGKVRAAVAFRSAGPLDPVLAPSVCLTERLAQPEQMGCESDESGAPFVSPGSLTCSAAFARQQQRRVAIELLARSGETWASVYRFEETVPYALAYGFLFFRMPAGQAFTPGDYTCRFSLDGQVVAERPFTVTAAPAPPA